MKFFRKLKNYYFYCGIEKEEYNELKRAAYISNFEVWRVLHFLMAATFGALFLTSLANKMMSMNRTFYLISFIYSIIAIIFFFLLKKDSLAAQLLIYLSMSVLFLFSCFISLNNPGHNATTFIVMLLITPMFMIDKPFFMTIELWVASAVFLFWMYPVKPHDVWEMDLINVVTYAIVGSILNVVANSIRIKEFVLTKKISIQKDTDEMTGLMNKGALTRKINRFLESEDSDKGTLFIMDIDKFKSINDIYGHDVGDSVIIQFAKYLAGRFNNGEITGRFGGDEYILFIKDADDKEIACEIAAEISKSASKIIELPDRKRRIEVSIGIAIYDGIETNYSDLFKKADIALYKAKADTEKRYCVYDEIAKLRDRLAE